jgi:cytochrome b
MSWPSGIPHEAVGTFALDVYAFLLALGFVLSAASRQLAYPPGSSLG